MRFDSPEVNNFYFCCYQKKKKKLLLFVLEQIGLPSYLPTQIDKFIKRTISYF